MSWPVCASIVGRLEMHLIYGLMTQIAGSRRGRIDLVFRWSRMTGICAIGPDLSLRLHPRGLTIRGDKRPDGRLPPNAVRSYWLALRRSGADSRQCQLAAENTRAVHGPFL